MNTFEITTAGNAAATVAETSGPKISIKTFKVGTSLAAVSPSHTNIQGSLVYTGNCSYFSRYSADTVQVICEIPANVGPVNFGEVGVFLDDGTMYARMAYSTLQFKASAAANGYGEVVRIHALLRLTQNPAIFNFYTGEPDEIGDVPNFTYIMAPSVDGNTPAYVVHESTPDGESMFIYKNTANLWTLSGYRSVGSATLTGSFPNTVTAALFSTLGDTAISGRYVIQTANGQLRKVTSITSGTATLNFSMAPVPAVGSTVQVLKHMSDASSLLELADASSVIGPDSMSPVVNEVLVHEPTSTGHSIHLVRQSATQWTPHGYYLYATVTPSAVSTPGAQTIITATAFGQLPRPSVANQYFVQGASSGKMIGCESISGNSITLTRAAPWITTSTALHIFRPVSERIYDPYTVDSLTDVDTVTLAPLNGDNLTWNGSMWVPSQGVPVGTVITGLFYQAAPGFLMLDGQWVSRTTYARLWAHAQALEANGGPAVVTDLVWASTPILTRGYFSQGDGSTMFRLPDARGLFLRISDSTRGIDASRGMGTVQFAQFPSHSHLVNIGGTADSGVYAINDSTPTGTVETGLTGGTENPAAGGPTAAGETRPINWALRAMIRY